MADAVAKGPVGVWESPASRARLVLAASVGARAFPVVQASPVNVVRSGPRANLAPRAGPAVEVDVAFPAKWASVVSVVSVGHVVPSAVLGREAPRAFVARLAALAKPAARTA